MYIDNLADIINKYNNAYHSILEMKPVDVKSSTLILITKIIRKTLNLKLVMMLEYENVETFL